MDILATGVTSTVDIAREVGLAEKTVRNLMSSAIGKYRTGSRSKLFLHLSREAGICP